MFDRIAPVSQHLAIAALALAMAVPLAIFSDASGPFGTSAASGDADVVVEVRSYNLKPGTRDEFHRLHVERSLPMARRWRIDVVGYGPSLHDKDSYFLVRAFPSLAERDRQEDAFYASDEWRSGPREAILAAIDNYTTVVIRMDLAALRALRASLQSSATAARP